MEVRAPARSVFELTKWYADAVSAEGDYWVGYSARLRYGAFSAVYSSILDRDGERHALHAAEVAWRDGDVTWKNAALGVDARWRGEPGEIRRTLYQDDAGLVDWRCVLPSACAATGRVRGLGYVERLRLTIPPWRLPIRSLRWGRFLSDRASLIWIDWQGDFACRSVWLNGSPIGAGELTDDGISLDGGLFARFDRGLVVRDGPLGSTVLSALPGLDRIAPVRMFRVRECKWLSRATLECPDAPIESGWAIHEVVTWP